MHRRFNTNLTLLLHFRASLQKISVDVVKETDTIVVHSTDITISKASGSVHMIACPSSFIQG